MTPGSLSIRGVCPNERTSPPSVLLKPSGRGRVDSEGLECGSNAIVHPVDTTLGSFQRWLPGLCVSCPDSDADIADRCPVFPILQDVPAEQITHRDAKYQVYFGCLSESIRMDTALPSM